MNRAIHMVKEFVYIHDEMYEVLRVIREDLGPVIDVWKEHLGSNKVFRKDGNLFFCRKVDDAIIIEEIKNN